MELSAPRPYEALLDCIHSTFTGGQSRAARAVHLHLLETYWQIGQHIVEFEQQGELRADYGSGLISRLAKDLTVRHGRGFSQSNLKAMRHFYLVYPKGQTLSDLLRWSHVVELLKIDDSLERGFYLKQMCTEGNAEGDAEPIDTIRSRRKADLLVEYATYGMNSQVVVQQYQLSLRNREELRRERERPLAMIAPPHRDKVAE
ncbi:MAG: DUF1016 N-terminal domain-containing protein [Planctomycetaceae bacterium]